MSHSLRFGRSYNTEMLRNKERLNKERGKDSRRDHTGWREVPGLGDADKVAFALKAARIS